MISVTFTTGVESVTTTEHLFQWDNGQKLSISGLNGLVSNLNLIDVHFANKVCEKAVTVKPTVVSNAIVAPIPNSLLQYGHPIIAYVYIPSDDGSRTIKMVIINVEPRKQPSDYVVEEDEAVITLETINKKVNTTLQTFVNDYATFKSKIESEVESVLEQGKIKNADKLQDKTASDFLQNLGIWATGDVKDLVIASNSGLVFIRNTVTGMPIDGKLWFAIINAGTVHKSITIYNFDGEYAGYNIYNSANSTWTGWKRLSDGGNADTVDSKHATDFSQNLGIWATGSVKDLALASNSGFIFIRNTVTDMPVDGVMWFGTVNNNTIHKQITVRSFDGVSGYVMTYNSSSKKWDSWKNIADGGNAKTVNGIKLVIGTADPQITDPNADGYVAEGTIYGQYA